MYCSLYICTDNRFEIIAAYKKKLIEGTNIESSPDEMAVIDNILFRFWQMGWLPSIPHGRLIDASVAYDKIAEQEGGNYVDMDAVGLGLDETPTIIPASKEG